jgi:hypothetical protein
LAFLYFPRKIEFPWVSLALSAMTLEEVVQMLYQSMVAKRVATILG